MLISKLIKVQHNLYISLQCPLIILGLFFLLQLYSALITEDEQFEADKAHVVREIAALEPKGPWETGKFLYERVVFFFFFWVFSSFLSNLDVNYIAQSALQMMTVIKCFTTLIMGSLYIYFSPFRCILMVSTCILKTLGCARCINKILLF